MRPISGAWVAQGQFISSITSREFKEHKKSRGSGVKAKRDIFDPFGDTDDLKIVNSGNIFAPLPDPFPLTEETFSPTDWTTPCGQIGYYNSQSPDWDGAEI